MTRHYSEDDLTLYYYGEGKRRGDIEHHVASCASCAAAYRDIASTLAMIATPDVPERSDQYGLEVWQRIRHQLPEQEIGFNRFNWFKGFKGFYGFYGFAAAAAALILVAFFAGQRFQHSSENPLNPLNPLNSLNPLNQQAAAASRRVLLTSVADHLDRTARVLTDVMNAPASSDISAEQRWAEDLLATSRLYRQDAIDAGEVSVATVLDDLERNLVEIVHSPSQISAADLEQIRRRIDAAALLFKVRVMSEELRQRDGAPRDGSRPRTSTGKIG
jgi:hypothetical protein